MFAVIKEATETLNLPKSKTTIASKNKGAMQNNGIAKMGSSHKTCETCEFWEGNRQLDTVNHGRIVNIIEKSEKCNCKQDTKNKSICQYNNTCTKWCKWNNMS